MSFYTRIAGPLCTALLLLPSPGRPSALFSLPGIDVTGSEALCRGNYEEARKQLEADTAVLDSAFHCLKLGVACAETGDHHRALSRLRYAAGNDSLLGDVIVDGAGDGNWIKAGVEPEIAILGGNSGIDQF